MVDRSFADLSLAALYDSLHPWGPGDDFYARLVRDAAAVLDVGCGTGRLLARARAVGHHGRLVGVDPAAAMLVQARRREPRVEWVLGDLRSHFWHGEFDLVVMTGHAFQALVTDDDVRQALHAVRNALRAGGRFVFDVVNPAGRGWEGWGPEQIHEGADAAGSVAWMWREVSYPVVGDRVTFTETYEGVRWDHPQISTTTLRLLDPYGIERLLAEAGLAVVEQYGDWGRGPVSAASPEIVTVAGHR
ncbi:class I SAM-dependent DNA methyltransferase [Streptomyces aquilus]|jgi:SAM-dependent methyltransferase|uniref:Class I SAM-dependent methyltransferase n=1 Tax=Streptomyces aquilus TaxID=2548456 RepID=A0A3Q9C2K8_9ACTN|nr:class I SAM-dependent methyltransferase [Streptomyces aquilus]AZP20206.1 class I SAM-dependent methyltransferase [Streptomyces aquilus]